MVRSKKRLKPIDPAVAVRNWNNSWGVFPIAGLAFAVVVVTPDKTLLKYTDGVRRASTNEPITNDTPIYIASQTKAYVGMLAARLDAEGILSLDDKITKHWPDVKFPEGVNHRITLCAICSGTKFRIEVGFITNMEAYICDLDPNDYPALIKEYVRLAIPVSAMTILVTTFGPPFFIRQQANPGEPGWMKRSLIP